MAARNPRQVSAENIDGDRGKHQDCAHPEAPVTMHAPPIRARIWLTTVVAVSFGVVPVSGHFFSILALHSPRRSVVSACAVIQVAWPHVD